MEAGEKNMQDSIDMIKIMLKAYIQLKVKNPFFNLYRIMHVYKLNGCVPCEDDIQRWWFLEHDV